MKNAMLNTDSDLHNNLKIYRLITTFIRANSFRSKVLIIAFIGTHVPLFAVIGYLIVRPNQLSAMAVFILVLTATLIGTAFVLWALYHMLKPLKLSSHALESYVSEGKLIAIPDDLEGEMGGLLRNILHTLKVVEERRLILEGAATNDSLTGLGNRLYAQQQLNEISTLMSRGNPDLSIALLDIDNFKKINDQYGHAIGDEVLAAAAKTMKKILQRESDWIARWGGEEFLILLNCSLEDAQVILDKIRQSLAGCQLHFNEHLITFTVSLGLTQVKPNEPIKDSISRADIALYRAKELGRNQIAVQQ
ncbi:MAG: GGDEF domain-containing protein [Bdellovibrio sp.]|nr:GGDEF domain-containing protein [Methylotenera sp.]